VSTAIMKTLARPHCCAIQWAAVEKAPDIGKVFLRVFYSLQKDGQHRAKLRLPVSPHSRS